MKNLFGKANMPQRVFRILSLAALAPLLFYLVLFFHNNIVLANYPFSIEWGEGIVIDLSHRIVKPSSVYKTLDDYPYIVGIYPPVYLYLANIAGRFFDNPFLGGRIVALSSAVGCAGLIFLILIRETERWEVSLIGALTYTSVSYIYDFAAMARVDSAGCFFALLGLYLIYRRHYYWAALFLAVALYTKQSMVAAPAACFTWLALREGRKALGPVLVFLGVCLGAFAALQLATGGWFFHHTVRYTMHSYYFSQLALLLRKSFAGTYVLIAFGILYICTGLRSRPRLDLLSLYWIAVCCTLLFAGKVGSSLFYLMEYAGACCLLFGLAMGRLYEFLGRMKSPVAYTATVMTFVLVGLQIYSSKDTCFYVKSFEGSRRMEAEGMCIDMIREERGPVLAEDVGLLINAVRPVLFHPFAISELGRLGFWDQGEFVADIRSYKFSMIILDSPASRPTLFTFLRFTPGILNAVTGNYRLVAVVGGRCVYRPR